MILGEGNMSRLSMHQSMTKMY